ncbi:MAG: P1 family peptidase [Deltaproteobacteria bacterium]|nr:P1 family peptidase [Deltaproteobacteria bacterium]
MRNAITDVPGIKVGHASDFKGYTGCTVILCEEGATCGMDIRGSASGTRQIDALSVSHIVEHIHALLLCGGSSFGLEAAQGVMAYLEEKGVGFDAGVRKIPIVPTAVIFDLGFGDPFAKPTPEMGYEACMSSSCDVSEGSVGVGVGATVGKLFEMERAMKGGVGTSSIVMPNGLILGALCVVNAFGDVLDNVTGKIIAGARKDSKSYEFADTMKCMREGYLKRQFGMVDTTLGVVATNAKFTKRDMTKIAQMAHGGIMKTISPAHTTFDGDLIFALSTGEIEADINLVGILAAFVVAEAIKRAVKKADGFGIVPAFKDIFKGSKVP